jgi:Rps23 Pro-64 3,4-dihydroxylase Tpa1-like proline 4-hydroxylase
LPEKKRVTIFRLNPDLDLPSLTREYAEVGRVRIRDLLEREGAIQLWEHLESRADWWHLINTPEGVLEYDRAARSKMSSRQRAALDERVFEGARLGFQYRYEGLRVPDDETVAQGADLLADFAELMSSDPMLDMLRTVTGYRELSFTDGHATSYGPGDFLTGHDDDVPGKDRLAAYVFGVTPAWRPEWGGLLLFHGADDSTVSGNVPRFNTLDLFSVPQRHSVSIVTPSAPRRRYAVTGWLRKGQRQ